MNRYKRLFENFVKGIKYKNDYVEIFKNPDLSELNKNGHDRGIITSKGDLFTLNEGDSAMGFYVHDQIVKILISEELIDVAYVDWRDSNGYEPLLRKFLNVQRKGTTRNWYIGESYEESFYKKVKSQETEENSLTEKIRDNFKKKNPYYELFLKRI